MAEVELFSFYLSISCLRVLTDQSVVCILDIENPWSISRIPTRVNESSKTFWNEVQLQNWSISDQHKSLGHYLNPCEPEMNSTQSS